MLEQSFSTFLPQHNSVPWNLFLMCHQILNIPELSKTIIVWPFLQLGVPPNVFFYQIGVSRAQKGLETMC